MAQSSADQFECAADGYSIAFVIFGLFFAILTAISVICLFRDVEDAVMAIFVFGVITLLSFFAAWATSHHRLIVEGNEATYVNVWGITKFTLVWHASRTLALILFWATVGIVVLMVVISISSGKNPLDQIVLLLELTLYIAGMFGCMFLGFMLYFALGLKEVKAIEKGLGLSFREEMAKRGAIGGNYLEYAKRMDNWYFKKNDN